MYIRLTASLCAFALAALFVFFGAEYIYTTNVGLHPLAAFPMAIVVAFAPIYMYERELEYANDELVMADALIAYKDEQLRTGLKSPFRQPK